MYWKRQILGNKHRKAEQTGIYYVLWNCWIWKDKKAAEMGHIWKEEGQKYIPSSDLYSLKQALQDTTMIMDREKVEASLLPGCQKMLIHRLVQTIFAKN